MVALRVRSVLALALVALVVGGCSTTNAPVPERSTAPATSVKAEPAGPARFDVSPIAKLRESMPPGFIPAPPSGVIELSPELASDVGSVVSYGKPFSVEPAGCRPLLQQVTAGEGALSQRVRGDEAKKRAISIGATTPVYVLDSLPVSGCDRMNYDVDQPEHPLRGIAERLQAPVIEGAVTVALRNVVDGDPNVEYRYSAIVDGDLYVDVDARLAPDFPAEVVLADLLEQAVMAVRGR